MCLWCGNVVPDGSNWQIFVYSFNIWINRNLGSEKPIREQHKNAEISTKIWSDFVALASFHWHCVMKESVVVVTMKIAISSLEKKTMDTIEFQRTLPRRLHSAFTLRNKNSSNQAFCIFTIFPLLHSHEQKDSDVIQNVFRVFPITT